MRVVHSPEDPCQKLPVGDMQPGDVVINGEGNLCMVMRDNDLRNLHAKVRVVNIQNGGNYSVGLNCKYERVDATVTWKRVTV